MKLQPIAIVGIGCRFPGADHPEAFWRLLCDGVDAITEVPPSRWDVDAVYHPDPSQPDRTNTRWGGFLEQVDRFDPQFFSIAPREAISMDPQQRLMLEVVWEALEDAGQVPEQLAGSSTGVFVGIGTHDYSVMLWQNPVNDPYATTGTGNCIAANRISYALDLRGPSLAVDTACSSSLVAVHLACQSLWQGESTLALAGGVNVLLLSSAMVGFAKSGFMAPDGRCKTFDASADGYVRGEGAGVVVLKPLAQARLDGDRIYAVIRGSAVNQDGRSNGLTAPNPQAQEAVLRAAYQQAGVAPAAVQYVEVHGTGTKLGDPMELKALGKVLSEGRSPDHRCAIGSVKTNIGHLETAAGIAGLIKVALSLKHQQLPPSLHFQTPNPYIDFAKLPFRVQTQLEAWQPESAAIAGVSSFGFGGTNAHVVLASAPAPEPHPNQAGDRYLLTLSAKQAEALRDLAQRYQAFLATHPDVDLANLCFTANARRAHFSHRLAVVGASADQMRQQLRAFGAGQETAGAVHKQTTSKKAPPIAFLFTGQGSQYAEMGRPLYETQPVFRAAIDRCDQILSAYLDRSLLSVLYPQPQATAATFALLDQTLYTQPALFALEYALAQLWQSWGIQPTAVMGHSVGEYVAACMAGVFSLEDGLKLIAARGRLMQALPLGGAMAAVFADAPQVEAVIGAFGAEVAIAAVNSPQNTVISGRREAIESVTAALAEKSVPTVRLNVSHAFHSPLMQPMLAKFAQTAAEVTYSPPQIKLISNVTGAVIGDAIASLDYWCQHVLEPVQFAASLTALHQLGYRTFVEVGAKPVLIGMGRTCLRDADIAWLPSLHPDRPTEQLLHSLGELHTLGGKVDWAAFHGNQPHQVVSLPTYPFQRQRYWWEAKPQRLHPLLGDRLYLAGTPEIRFQTQISLASPAYLSDHRLWGQVVLPAAAYAEMLLLAGGQAFPTQSVQLENVAIERPLYLTAGQPKTLQILLKPEADGHAFRIFSFDPGKENSCTLHAAGLLTDGAPAADRIDLAQLRSAAAPVALSDYYAQLAAQGLEYGDRFRAIQQLWQGAGYAIAKIQLPDGAAAAGDRLHPVLLDASLQALGAIATAPPATVYLPIGFDRLQINRPLGETVWSYVQLEAADAQFLRATVQIVDAAGDRLATVTGLALRAVERQTTDRSVTTLNLQDWLYDIVWQTQPLDVSAQPNSASWLIFADGQGVGAQLAADLEAQGDRCTLVYAPAADARTCPDGVNSTQPEAFQQLLRRDSAIDGVVHLWSLDSTDPMAATGCASVLHLVQALMQEHRQPRLWLVTQRAQAIGAEPLNVAQAPLWGLGRVIANEHPDLRCTCIDLDGEAIDLAMLRQELAASGCEHQIAYRQGDRYVARLMPHAPSAPIQLQTAGSGVLDDLRLVPQVRRSPAADEVEIQVCAAGLNFRDVLNALGMLQPQLEALGLESIPFGGDCAGRIAAVGAAVQGLQVGDAVIAGQAIGSLASYVTAKADWVVPKPAELSFTEAATLPIAFLTAGYGLQHLAKLRAGESVLIHAAAGGVGQAAVQIALRAGAKVFATASPQKWEGLKAMGVHHVMNSRSLDFAEEIGRLTQGRGVDVVLNSLNGDFIPKSLEVLASGGRFVEIGKLGIWQAAQVQQHRPDVTYLPFDLLEVAQAQPQTIAALLCHLMQAIARGELTPLPQTVFPIAQAAAAFRHMAQAKHRGKVVITLPDPPQPFRLQPDGSYLIAGGLGALGLQTARWLVEQGARQLILAGRRSPTAAAAAAIDQLRQAGAAIRVVQTDIADQAAVDRLIQSCDSLKGVIHAAGVLDDGVLVKQSWQRFGLVFAPKVAGAWNLHQATQQLSLDFFVCFSSIAAWLGSPGQGSYAAANAFLDAIAHQRRQQGLPGLSISWSAWAAGMAARLTATSALAARGIEPIAPQQGFQVLSTLLEQRSAQVGVLPIQWSRFRQSLSSVSPFWSAVLPTELVRPLRSDPLQPPAAQPTPATDRRSLLLSQIRAQLARVLGFKSADAVPMQQSFTELGMDSLMAVEFVNSLQTLLEKPISLSRALNCATIEALVDYLTEPLPAESPNGARAAAVQPSQNGKAAAPPRIAASDPAAAQSNGKAPTASPRLVSPAFYQFDQSPEYLNMKQYLNGVNQTGNPFFTVHDGIARDTIETDGRELINYASYNYLGMSGDPAVTQAAKAAIDRYGTSVSASRVVAGERPLHQMLERAIADWIGAEDCIVYVGGHTTNETTIGHLFGKRDLIVYDALSHNSIRQGCALSQATAIEFPHNDWQTLDQILAQRRYDFEKVLIAIEGVYSTDGDIAPLPEILAVKQRHKTFLLVDEAHSIGVLGPRGRGIGEYFNVAAGDVDLWMGTLSKSFASCGGYIAGCHALVEYLKYTAPGFVFSVGMSPPNTAAALAALRQLQAEPERVARLRDRAQLFLSLCQQQGLNTGTSQDSPIVPVIVGEPDRAVRLSQLLRDRGINVLPMVYPSVPYNGARLRFFLSATHTEAQIRFTVEALTEALAQLTPTDITAGV